MTEHIDDPAVAAELADDVRRMLRRRAGDVPDRQPFDRATTRSVGRVERDGCGSVDPDISGWDAAVLDPRIGRIPWHRRVGVLVAVAAVVVVAVGIGVASLTGGTEQQVAVGAASTDGPTVLVPPDGDSFTLDRVEVPPAGEPGGGDVATIEYGPTDGDLTRGIAVVVAEAEAEPEALAGGTLVGEQQSATLADVGAVFEGPAVVSWLGAETDETRARSLVTVLWYGEGIGQAQGLAVAAAVAADPRQTLDGDSLPAGWAVRSASEVGESHDPMATLAMSGPWPATLASFSVELPFAFWAADLGYEGEAVTHRPVEIRGGAGLLIERTLQDDDGSLIVAPSLLWHEAGSTHQFRLMEVMGGGDVDLVDGVERLVAVDLEEARRRAGGDDAAGSTATTSIASTPTPTPTTSPPPTQTTGPASTPTTGPPFSMTAPGPGAIEQPTPTTGPGQTTDPVTATTEEVPLSTEGADGSMVTISIPEPLRRPDGEFLPNAVVPVVASTFGDQAYEVGVVWAPPFGFCMGVDFDGAITEGGFPVECEPEPWIGGGGSRIAPDGVLVFAFADAATTAATLELDGVVNQAEVNRVPEFPEFSLLVFAFPGATAESLDGVALPGAIALFDQAGQPVGWG